MDRNNISNVVLESLNEVKDISEIIYKQEDLNKTLKELSITSIDFIKFIILLEEKLGFEMPDEFLLFINTNTVKKMIEIIENIYGEYYEL